MHWTVLADTLWQVRPWMLPVLLSLYAVPLLRLITLPFECGGRLSMPINRRFGQWEHLVRPLRDGVVDAYLIAGAAWLAWRGIAAADASLFAASGIALALAMTGIAMRAWRREAHLRLIAFAPRFPTIHPQEFFDHLLCSSGAVRHALPEQPFSRIDPAALDFRTGRPSRRGVGPIALLAGAWSTLWLARLVLFCHRRRGADAARALASSLAVIWGSRTAQLARATVTVEGIAHLPPPGGPQMVLFTHMSFLDFALAPLALAARPDHRAPEEAVAPPDCLPCFLLARDHFRENFFYYRVLGIGRAAEALGMIFVERRRGEPRERAALITRTAAAALVDRAALLALFPQGTRVTPCVGARGERLDSAYYTVGSRERIGADGKHLKTGAARIALEAAREMGKRGERQPILIVPIALSGTGLACPRGSMRILPNIHIRLRVGDPIAVEPLRQEAAPETVARLHSRIDGALKNSGRIHAELERRFFEDMRGLVDPLKIEEVAIAMKPWRGEDFLLHAILDAIYACPPRCWRTFVGELVHLLLGFASRDELLAFKGRVADAVPM